MGKLHSFIRRSVLPILFVSFATANAASISLSPLNNTVKVGQEASFQINMDFTDDPTIGGGIDILFGNFSNGNELTFVSYVAADLGEEAFRLDPSVESGQLTSIGFGAFDGLSGPALVGTLTFTANQVGEYLLTPVESTGMAGGFFALVPFGDPAREQDPEFVGASLSVVPLPAAFWLMASALGMVFGLGRKRS